MRLVDVERWVGIPYDEAACDCADLVMQVQRALFAREVALPGRRPRGRRGSAELGALSRAQAVPREGPPQDGDLVLMIERGQHNPGHAGVFFSWLMRAGSCTATKRTAAACCTAFVTCPDLG